MTRTKVNQLKTVAELFKLWPRLCKLTSSSYEPLTLQRLLRLLLACLDRGAVFLVYGDSGLVGFACAERINSIAVLHCLPKDDGLDFAHACLKALTAWAKDQGIRSIRVTTANFSGASFKYFRHCLKFRQAAVTFSLKV